MQEKDFKRDAEVLLSSRQDVEEELERCLSWKRSRRSLRDDRLNLSGVIQLKPVRNKLGQP
ncbi:hypothetical protein F2P79_017802 [Pimephales promelas]|nr:hypothetical protein F2P79_017802 [Pimephales promelas]